nr:ABC transporter permease [Acidimicrobiia bacterium]
MFSYIVRRLLLLIPTVFLALSFLFFLFFILPGDPATLIAGGADRRPDAGVIARAAERYGLNDPVLVQFGNFWKRAIQWDLGESFISDRSVNELLGEKAPRSIRLAIWATLLEVLVGITVGLVSAVRRYSLSDKVTTFLTAGAAAIPAFVLGFILQYGFAVYPNKHDWPQWTRLRTSDLGPDSWAFFFIPTQEQWRYLILPVITLACVSTALAARMMRGSMLEVMRADYMRTARAKGLSERGIIMRHGLRNALIPVVTLIGIDFGTVIGSAVLTETVFDWPGIGSQIADSVRTRDLPVILGLTLVVVIAYSLIN